MRQQKDVLELEEVLRLGYVPRWLVCGPFPAGDPSHLYRLYQMGRLDMPESDPLGGELFFEPREGMVHSSDLVPDRGVEWRTVQADSEWLDLSRSVDHGDHGIIYAAVYLRCSYERLVLCDFVPFALGRLIHNHRIVSPENGPLVLRIRKGTNLLLFKVLGSKLRGGPWGMTCTFRTLKTIGSSGVAITSPRPTGFFRGSGEHPEIEVEFEVANVGRSDVTQVEFSCSLRGSDNRSEGSVEHLVPGQAVRIRHGVPVPRLGLDRGTVLLEVRLGEFTETLQEDVAEVHPPADGTIVVGAGFHCDPVWTNTQSMYNDISLNNVTQYLNVCRADPDYKVILHELDYLKPYYDFYLSDREYMTLLSSQRRIILGGSYNEPNEKNVSGEQLIRNVIYGKLFARSQFGQDPKVYHAWCLGRLRTHSSAVSDTFQVRLRRSDMVKASEGISTRLQAHVARRIHPHTQEGCLRIHN